MVSPKFRQQLRKEAQKWQAEGLIDDSIFNQLAQRYEFEALETSSKNRFITILLGLGGVLLGLGVITLVAANWQAWSPSIRVVILVSVFLAINLMGFWGWRSRDPKWQRLGKALLLLGSLMLGANIALMSQMFHQSGDVYELYWVWGTGVLAMAYGLSFSWLAIIAIILLGMGYWWGLPNVYHQETLLSPLIPYIPIIATALLIPLAKRCQSQWVLFLAIIAVVSSFEVAMMTELAAVLGISPVLAAVMITAAIAIPPLLLWSVETVFYRITVGGKTRCLSITVIAITSYLLSFHNIGFSPHIGTDSAFDAQVLLPLLGFGGLTIYSWWQLGHQGNVPWRLSLISTLVAVTSMVTGLIAGWSLLGAGIGPTIAYNVIVLLLAIALVYQGLHQGTRFSFWGGMGLMTLQILSRMLEYQTDLVLKAVVLLSCGLAILMAGSWFESYVKNSNS